MDYEFDFLKALLTTVIVEAGVIFLLIRCICIDPGFNINFSAWAGILPSIATLPYVWFVFPAFFRQRQLYAATSEVFAVVAETFIIAMILGTKLRTAFFLSLAANAASVLVGLLLFRL